MNFTLLCDWKIKIGSLKYYTTTIVFMNRSLTLLYFTSFLNHNIFILSIQNLDFYDKHRPN